MAGPPAASVAPDGPCRGVSLSPVDSPGGVRPHTDPRPPAHGTALLRTDHPRQPGRGPARLRAADLRPPHQRSEEHTSELQSLRHLVCRLLLEKKKG